VKRRLAIARALWRVRRTLKQLERTHLMELRGIHAGDLVEVDRKGHQFIALVEQSDERELTIKPLDRRVTYTTATARQITKHWRRAGTRRPPRRRGAGPAPAPPGQTTIDTLLGGAGGWRCK
jgi:hypothetical protein